MDLNQTAPLNVPVQRDSLLLHTQELDMEQYFQSLLRLGALHGLITEEETEQILTDCFALLNAQTKGYTSGESSSIPLETAQALMDSILYTIGAALKAEKNPHAALSLLRETTLKALFQKGQAVLRRQVSICNVLYQSVKTTLIPTANIAYKDTIAHGFTPFFKSYDLYFFAHETVGIIDYPLCVDLMKLTGVEYIRDYLEKLVLENQFCRCFHSATLHRMMQAANQDYPELLVNLFQQTLANALGRVLCGMSPSPLWIDAPTLERLNSLFSALPPGNTEVPLRRALEQLLKQLCLSENNALARYGAVAIKKLAAEVDGFLPLGHLSSLFVCFVEV